MARLVLIFLILCAPLLARAEDAPDNLKTTVDPQNMEIAEDIVKAFDLKNQMHAMVSVLSGVVMPMLTQANPGQDDKIMETLTSVVEKNIDAHLSELEHNKAQIYADLFSNDELRQLRDFYQSPVGRKMITTTPEIMKRGAEMQQGLMLSMMKDIKRDIVEQIKKNGMKVPTEMGV